MSRKSNLRAGSRAKRVRSENLAVVFTDIVGFTATTAGQSREANASLLSRHDNLLIPIARKFGGRRVKSIGDALLLVFRSSTDALLCGMAMQDALYDHNRKHRAEPEIHIRVSVNVGEVRVTKGDVFGEAVNIAARLEGITPADAIYLTKAVYMTMNRAEVPVEEVGSHEFKGIEEPIEVYQVPRFAAARLVPETRVADGAGPDQGPREGFTYPYGGLHLVDYGGRASPMMDRSWRSPLVLAGGIGGLLLIGAALAYLFWPQLPETPPPLQGTDVRVHLPPPPPLPPPPEHFPARGPVLDRLRERVGPIRERVQAFKIQVLMEQVWPWLTDEHVFVSPLRLKDAPLPLGSPRPDELAGALPIAWDELPGADQVAFSSLEDSWSSLDPGYQNHLVKTGRLWRNATPDQRRAVIDEVRRWRQVEGVERTIASRRLDYLRGLDPAKRQEAIERKDLGLSLEGSGGETLGRVVPRPMAVSPPSATPPRSIWERPRSAPDGGGGRGTSGGYASRPPPPRPEWDDRGPPPPPPGFDGHRPPPPPRREGHRPPPPWERGGDRRPPPR